MPQYFQLNIRALDILSIAYFVLLQARRWRPVWRQLTALTLHIFHFKLPFTVQVAK